MKQTEKALLRALAIGEDSGIQDAYDAMMKDHDVEPAVFRHESAITGIRTDIAALAIDLEKLEGRVKSTEITRIRLKRVDWAYDVVSDRLRKLEGSLIQKRLDGEPSMRTLGYLRSTGKMNKSGEVGYLNSAPIQSSYWVVRAGELQLKEPLVPKPNDVFFVKCFTDDGKVVYSKAWMFDAVDWQSTDALQTRDAPMGARFIEGKELIDYVMNIDKTEDTHLYELFRRIGGYISDAEKEGSLLNSEKVELRQVCEGVLDIVDPDAKSRYELERIMGKVTWDLLSDQKAGLVAMRMSGLMDTDFREKLNGIIHLIDNLEGWYKEFGGE